MHGERIKNKDNKDKNLCL